MMLWFAMALAFAVAGYAGYAYGPDVFFIRVVKLPGAVTIYLTD